MNSLSVEIRAAEQADATRIADLYLASRKRFVACAPLAHPDQDVHRWIGEQLVPSGAVSVAVLDNQIVGMCATSQDDTVGWIDQLYIQPEHVGRGVGTTLLRHAIQQFRLPIRLYTFQENLGAQRFYERHGFVAIAFGDGSANEEGVPDVLYELHTLPTPENRE